jgi:hypothetical protein
LVRLIDIGLSPFLLAGNWPALLIIDIGLSPSLLAGNWLALLIARWRWHDDKCSVWWGRKAEEIERADEAPWFLFST